jgi:APA family basic amino acid/polyamine antiporter
VFYLLAVFAVMVLRWRAPQAKRSYHVWGYPVVPLVFVAVYVWFLAQAYSSNPVESRAGVGFILLGIPVFYLYQTWIKRERHAPS